MEEVSKLLAEKTALMKQLNSIKGENFRLVDQLQETEKSLKRRAEEVEALQIYNNQLVHKCESLQNDKKSSQWGLWWGKTRVDDRMQVLEEELANKIAENEQVHIKIFESRQKFKAKLASIKERLASAEDLVRESAFRIETQGIEIIQYQKCVQELIRDKKENLAVIDEKNREIVEMQNFYLKNIAELKAKVAFLEGKLRNASSLDLTDFDKYAKWQPGRYSKNLQFKQNEWMGKVQQSLLDSIPFISNFWVKYCTRLNALHISSQSSTKKLVSLIQSQSVSVCSNYEKLLKTFCCSRSKNVLKDLQVFASSVSYFFRLIGLELDHQSLTVEDPSKISRLNQDLQKTFAKLEKTAGRVLSFLILSGSTAQSFWHRIQDCSHLMVSEVTEAVQLLSSRLAVDKTLRFKSSLKEQEVINESLQKDLQVIPGSLSQFYSELMQIKANFYYSLSSSCQLTTNYLKTLRALPQSEGVSFTKALEDVETLRETQEKIKEQVLVIQGLEKTNSALVKEINKLRTDVTRLENELAAVEQNCDRNTFETGNDLLHEPESLSEDVKSGAQRFAVRLTDCNGEPVPLSSLTVTNDVYLKIQELAVNKIQELSLKLKGN